MGIPYSREINAAFDQVTPLVAAGFKVLKTTKNISILLAVIQVLTVLFLALILWVMIALVYCVNPDLEAERRTLVTPIFQRLAHVTFIGILESIAAALVGFGGFVAMGFFFLSARSADETEKVGNQDADKALESMDEADTGAKKEKKKKKKGKGGKEDKDQSPDGVR
ncbi:hypothetical protein K491DRAFT_719839 [Lophiostoma macrostomum CBS 122681]|uniref:Uncharacterized protein n=1 Tax=Lophiostoma macrostomum CBS 122681 TaxID=1314788 RepID=A0A6A6SUH8_9PLEO|nr:hypothetical protein K491DRAFT_719839 [Lophiostoma macrostomum CBS 122681]